MVHSGVSGCHVFAINTTETAGRQPQIAVPVSANSNYCGDRLRLRLLSAAAKRITASFRVLHVCATDGLMLTAAADVKLHKKLIEVSVCKPVPEREGLIHNQPKQPKICLEKFPPVA